ncbi:hypothetical protein DH2020_030921 [Rehmannia glutinosa]|uniref:Protein kinase domain-containing protein n=1 Tax=Rehmannia glutinosa TaxID=99300 RepID=A0ABR0VL62_REHGL
MSKIYDNWERLVAAVLRKEQLWQLFHDQSRSPSTVSEPSDPSSSLCSPLYVMPFDFLSPKVSSSPYGKSGELLPKLVFTAKFSRPFNLADLLKASAQYLGRGTFGSVYTANLDNGTTVVVKRLKKVSVSEPQFKRREGIAHIHAQIGGKLVHGNIKASNIFINSQRYGCVSDIGLADMIVTNFMPTAKCYAPEVKNTQDVSQESDVYSFEVLLLEILTGKSPVQATSELEALDLVKWVSSINRKEWIAEISDINSLKNHTVKEQIVKMLQIGISCVAKSPKKRPKMSAVAKMIEDIIMMNMGYQVSMKPEMNKLVFFRGGNETFDLEDLLRASAEVLGKGTFGTSYKAILENGITIVVKRLREVIAYYYSKDEKLLVYGYYNQDSVATMLHGKKRFRQDTFRLENPTKKIAVGAARGVAHIHRQEGGKLVHGNIRTSNIFLNEQQYGVVSDVGLAKLLIPITLSVLRTAGYCAPGIKDITKMSQNSDVYSFGVVLLELVSGKPPIRTKDNGETLTLMTWIESVIREEWTNEVFDVELLRYQHDKEAMVRFLQIAMDCVVSDPKRRPKMAEVVRMLEEISEVETVSSSSAESKLKDLLTLS